MAELKLNEALIHLAKERLEDCWFEINGVVDTLFVVKEEVIFKRKIVRIREKYRDLRDILLRLSIHRIDEDDHKYNLYYDKQLITSDTEYIRCMKDYRKAFEPLNLEKGQFDLIREDIRNLLATLDSALRVENKEE